MSDPESEFRSALAQEPAVATPGFAAHKARMRDELIRAMRTHHRKRKASRVLLAAGVLLLAVWAWPRRPATDAPHAATPLGVVAIEYLRGHPSPRPDWRAVPGPEIVIERISDDQALELLKGSEQPGGLARIAGRTLFVSHDARLMD